MLLHIGYMTGIADKCFVTAEVRCHLRFPMVPAGNAGVFAFDHWLGRCENLGWKAGC